MEVLYCGNGRIDWRTVWVVGKPVYGIATPRAASVARCVALRLPTCAMSSARSFKSPTLKPYWASRDSLMSLKLESVFAMLLGDHQAPRLPTYDASTTKFLE